MIQIRERELSARDLCRLVRLALGTATKPRVLVNDRADIAIACGAHGVHLRSQSIAPAQIRQIKGWKIKEMIVSVSCHNAEDAERAEREGADYCVLAPVFRPLSKIDSREPLGLSELRKIAEARTIPVIALGGVTPQKVLQCLEAGAAGVAGITLFQ